jgi:hypothetical protein
MRIGLGGITTPVATIEEISGFLIDSGVKHSSLQGEKIIGQVADAIYCWSSLKNLENLYFSVAAPGFVSFPKVGLKVNLRNPAWNSMSDFASTMSLFSRVLFILKCITESLHSFGNRVLAIRGCFRVK